MKLKTFVLLGVLVVSTLTSFAQSFDLKASIERGQALYQVNCQSCHMSQGEGLPGVYPPLANSEHLSDKERTVKVIINGLSGPIEVKGIKYNTPMSGHPLSDQEVADVMNYIRNSFGNSYGPVKPEEIQPALKK
ncbi:cytochrome c [Limibacter armeniacum]|uniref:cytochrome c n=1 Tax=Limibacter armeniacum TaxID=466084 RepID=UPI002FE5F16A